MVLPMMQPNIAMRPLLFGFHRGITCRVGPASLRAPAHRDGKTERRREGEPERVRGGNGVRSFASPLCLFLAEWSAVVRQGELVPPYLGPTTAVVVLCLMLSLPHVMKAAEERSISVTGNGEVKARPNRLEIELQASGTAELTDDAIVKYDDALRRVTGAFDALKLEHLSIERGDLSFSSVMTNVAVARGRVAAKPQTAIAQSLKLTLGNVNQMSQKELVGTVGKLIDAAQDAGAIIVGTPGGNMVVNQLGRRVVMNNQSSQPAVAFLLDDFEALHDRAYQKAFEDATARAEKLARLAHAKLGEILSISENSQAYYGAVNSSQQSLVSVRLTEIPVNVSLFVRFAIERSEEGK
jgi:uncharacterized protein YggE